MFSTIETSLTSPKSVRRLSDGLDLWQLVIKSLLEARLDQILDSEILILIGFLKVGFLLKSSDTVWIL
jgi:hypothetical protein